MFSEQRILYKVKKSEYANDEIDHDYVKNFVSIASIRAEFFLKKKSNVMDSDDHARQFQTVFENISFVKFHPRLRRRSSENRFRNSVRTKVTVRHPLDRRVICRKALHPCDC